MSDRPLHTPYGESHCCWVSLNMDEKCHKHYIYHFLSQQPWRSCRDAEYHSVSSCTASDREIQLWSKKDFCIYVERQLKRSSASRNAVAPSPHVVRTPLTHSGATLNSEAISKLEDVVNCNEFISVQTIKKRLADLEQHCNGTTINLSGEIVCHFIEDLKSDMELSFSLTREDSKTEVLKETLQKLCKKDYTVGKGNIVERPSLFALLKLISICTTRTFQKDSIISEEENDEEINDDDDKDIDEAEIHVIRGGVCETKSTDYSYYQLYTVMMHFSVQMAVKALMNGVLIDETVLYGVSINYDEQKAKLYKMQASYVSDRFIMYGLNNLQPMPIPDALNYVATAIC